jgi:hypothetical protein
MARMPSGDAAESGDAILQRLLEHEREEAAEHVTADGVVELIEDRPGSRAGLRDKAVLLNLLFGA